MKKWPGEMRSKNIADVYRMYDDENDIVNKERGLNTADMTILQLF